MYVCIMNVCMYGCMDVYMYVCMYGLMYVCMDVYGWMDGWMDGYIYVLYMMGVQKDLASY